MNLTPTSSSPRFITFIALPLILLIATLLAFSFLNEYQNWGDDWAQYMLQAKAILDHDLRDCIEQNAFMTRESSLQPGPVAYPWGLPLLLAAEAFLFSFTLHVFKLFNIMIFISLIFAIFLLMRRFLTDSQSLAAACMFAFNPVLLHYCNHILTELPFTLASVCAFLSMEQHGSSRRSLAISRLATGALAFMAFTFRVNGVLILAAATTREFLPNKDRWCRPSVTLIFLPYISFSLLYFIWNALFPAGGEGYWRILSAFTGATLLPNTLTYSTALFEFFTGGHHSDVLAIFLGPLVLLGALITWRRTAHYSVYGMLTLALYIVWPTPSGYRYLIPLTPVLVLLLMLGLEGFAQLTGKAGWVLARTLQCGVPLLFLIVASALVVTGRLPQEKWNPYDQSSSEMFQWIRTNTASSAVISFFKPRAMHLLGDRISLTATPADAARASYLVYTKELIWNEDQPTLAQYQQEATLMPIFENHNFVIYRVLVRP